MRKSWAFTFTAIFLIPLLVTMAIDVIILRNDGLPERFAKHSADLLRDTGFLQGNFCFEKINADCRIGKSELPAKMLLFGDSNAAHYLPFWDEVGKYNNISIYGVGIDRCYPLLDVDGNAPSLDSNLPNHNCPGLLSYVRENILRFDTIIMAGAWFGYIEDPKKPRFLEEFESTVAYLVRNKRRVIVMEEAPVFNSDLFNQLIRSKYSIFANPKIGEIEDRLIKSAVPNVDHANSLIRALVLRHPGALYLAPITIDPDLKAHLPFVGKDLAYRDGGHLNEYGSRQIALKNMKEISKNISK